MLEIWDYLGISFAVILGSLGLPIPEELVHLVAGYRVSEGRLWLPAVLVVDTLSVVVGDNLGFWAGRLLGTRILASLERVAPARLYRVQAAVARHGPLAVFAARFIPGLRCMAGPVTGAAGLQPYQFMAANGCAAALHVPSMLALGFLYGAQAATCFPMLRHLIQGAGGLLLGVAAITLCGIGLWHIRAARRFV